LKPPTTKGFNNSFATKEKMVPMKTHPAMEGLLRLKGRTGTLYLECEDLLLALFHLEEGRFLKATGLITLTTELSPKDPLSLLSIEIAHLRQVEREKGWYHAWLLVAEQLSLSLFAIRTLPGKKRLRFLANEPPEEVRYYGAGYPLREDILELFFRNRQVADSAGGEEWEDFAY
jgi:hypothetical protein